MLEKKCDCVKYSAINIGHKIITCVVPGLDSYYTYVLVSMLLVHACGNIMWCCDSGTVWRDGYDQANMYENIHALC